MTSSREEEPSNVANPDRGYNGISKRLRSVLMSPISMAFFDFLHDLKDEEHRSIKELFGDFVNILAPESDIVNRACSCDVFKDCYTQWKGSSTPKKSLKKSPSPRKKAKVDAPPNEKALTKLLAEKLNRTLLHGTGLHAESELLVDFQPESVIGTNQKPAFIDMLVYDGNDVVDNATDAVLLLEVGFSKPKNDVNDWWTKADQGVHYMECLDNAKKQIFTNRMICAILTIDKEPNLDFKSAKLGVFLCERVAANMTTTTQGLDFRMSLLWHQHCNRLEQLSEDFGRLVQAARVLPNLNSTIAPTTTYEYLGPNCSRVGDMVHANCCALLHECVYIGCGCILLIILNLFIVCRCFVPMTIAYVTRMRRQKCMSKAKSFKGPSCLYLETQITSNRSMKKVVRNGVSKIGFGTRADSQSSRCLSSKVVTGPSHQRNLCQSCDIWK
jgi:hypothetical protein